MAFLLSQEMGAGLFPRFFVGTHLLCEHGSERRGTLRRRKAEGASPVGCLR
jgi:hypothetical protein